MTEQPEKNDLAETIAGKVLGIGFVLLAAYFLFQLAIKMAFSRLLSGSGSDLERAMTMGIFGIPVFLAVIGAFGAAAIFLFLWQMKNNPKKPDSAKSPLNSLFRGLTLGLPILIAVILFLIVLIIWTLGKM